MEDAENLTFINIIPIREAKFNGDFDEMGFMHASSFGRGSFSRRCVSYFPEELQSLQGIVSLGNRPRV